MLRERKVTEIALCLLLAFLVLSTPASDVFTVSSPSGVLRASSVPGPPLLHVPLSRSPQSWLSDLQSSIDKTLNWVSSSAVHYAYWLPSNLPNTYAGSSTIGPSITVPNFVDPTVSVNGSTYTYTTSFGVYLITPGLSGATYTVSFRTAAMAAGSSISTTGFVLLEDHSGSFTQFPIADYGSASVTYTNTNFVATWTLTYNSVAVASVRLSVDFSRTAFPKISSDLNTYSYQVNPSCIPTVASPCATATYWNNQGLKDFKWEWIITPSAGYDQYQSSSQGTISLISVVTSHAVQYANPVQDGTVPSVSFGSWFAEWNALGSKSVYISAVSPLSNTPAILTMFDMNNSNIDPTFGITSTGSTSYPTTNSGDTTQESTGSTFVCDQLTANLKFTTTSAYTLQTINIYQNVSGASQSARFGLYVDNGNTPVGGSKVSGSEIDMTLSTSTGWRTYSYATQVYLAAGTYWVVANLHTPNISNFFVAKQDQTLYAVYPVSGIIPLPSTFPTATGTQPQGSHASIYFTGVQIEGYTKGTRVQYTDATCTSCVTSFNFYVSSYTSGDKVVLVFYDDSSGNPNHELWNSSTSGTDLGGTGWKSINESSGTVDNSWNVGLVNNGYYWFMWQINNVDSMPSYASGATGSGVYLAQTFGTLLSTFSGGTLTTENWSMYLTYAFVTQPIQLTVAESGASTGTFSLSGCNVSPTTVAGDGAVHNFVVAPSCSLTVTVPTDGATSRDRFYQAPWPTGATTWSFLTCASGTCSTQSNTYHYQLQATFTTSGIGSDTSANVVSVNGTSYTQSQVPVANWWDYNSQATYNFLSPIASTTSGKQYAWASTSGLSQTLQTNTYSVTTGGTVTGTYNIQYDLKIQAVDGYTISQSPQNVLKTSEAAMNMTVSGGSTTIILADANGYMDFGYITSGTQVYLTAKYLGTVVNSTWHTSLYTINSVSVYQWKFEYQAYIAASVSVAAGQASDSTQWNFTYHVKTNSSATFNTGTVKVYYQKLSYLVCTQTISSSSFTVCTATQSLAGPSNPPGNTLAYLNVTDSYIWVRSSTTVNYGVTDIGLTNNAPLTWTSGNPGTIAWSYTNNATAGSTKLVVTHTFMQLSILNPTIFLYLYNNTGSYFNATANALQSGNIVLTIPTSFAGAFVLRLLIYQHLMNGTNLIVDHYDVTISTSSAVSQAQPGNQIIYVPEDVSFDISQVNPGDIPQVNQTRTVNVTVNVNIMNPVHNLAVTQISTNAAWVTVTDKLPIIYSGLVTTFPLHLQISPGLNIPPQGWQVTIILQGTLDGGILYQGIKYLVVVYPNQAPIVSVPNSTLPQIVTYGSVAVTGVSLAVQLIRRKH